MKQYILPSLKLTGLLILICGILYPLLIALIGSASTGNGGGIKLEGEEGSSVGYENIGQKFTDESYFQGRPSAVDYNSAGSGGSNKGPSNTEYLAIVQSRIDTFLIHNPEIKKSEIPSELVTSSGSGLDPDLSVKAARVQTPRIAKLRHRNAQEIYTLIERFTEKPFLGIFGIEKVNVLKLNLTLNKM